MASDKKIKMAPVKKLKIVRAATISGSLDSFCNGLLRELSDEYEVVAVASDKDENLLSTIAEREGVKTVDVKMNRQMSPFADLGSLWRLYRLFRRERPTMVHSMTPKAGLLCMMAAKMARVPVRVHTFTGLIFPTSTGLKRRILMLTDRLTCSCATHVIPEGEGVKNDLANNHITRKPMRVLGHGNVRGINLKFYDPTLFSQEKEAKAPVVDSGKKEKARKPFTFIFIGRLVGDKGINELVEAFITLHNENPDTRLILVGRDEPELDPLKPETSAMIERCDAIEAVGQLQDVRPWLAKADCAVLPSYREGFPNVVIEAGAMGLPQIVTDINGSREIISEGVNGTIIPPRDTQALLEAMRRMTTDCDWRATMRNNARDMIASRFEQSYVRRCLRDFYREILSNHQPSNNPK